MRINQKRQAEAKKFLYEAKITGFLNTSLRNQTFLKTMFRKPGVIFAVSPVRL